MAAPTDPLSALGLGELLAKPNALQNSAGQNFDGLNTRCIFTVPENIRGWRHVLERERAGSWRDVMKACGRAQGKVTATRLDARLGTLAQAGLGTLPLEASLSLLQRVFAAQGWGVLSIDLTHASEHGLVVARLDNSYFAAAFPNAEEFVDPLPAGFLQEYFQHISGQALGCEEVACAARGAPQCVFVITAAERLAPLLPNLGRQSADSVIAQLSH